MQSDPPAKQVSIYDPDVPWPETLTDRVLRTRLSVADIFQRALAHELTTQAAQLRDERAALKLRRVTSTAFLTDATSRQQKPTGGAFAAAVASSPGVKRRESVLCASFSFGDSGDDARNGPHQRSTDVNSEDGLDLAGKILRAVEVEVIREVQKLADGMPKFLASQKTTMAPSATAAAAGRVGQRSPSIVGPRDTSTMFDDSDPPTTTTAGDRQSQQPQSPLRRQPSVSHMLDPTARMGQQLQHQLQQKQAQDLYRMAMELQEAQVRVHDLNAVRVEQEVHIEALKAFCLRKDSAMQYIRSTIFTELNVVKEQLRMQQADPSYTSNFVTIFDAWKVMEGDDPSGGKEAAVKMAKAEAANDLARAHAAFALQLRERDEEMRKLRTALDQKNNELSAAVAASASFASSPSKKGGKRGSQAGSDGLMEQLLNVTQELAQRDIQLEDAETNVKMLRSQITSLEDELSHFVNSQNKNESQTKSLVALRDAEITSKCQLIEELEHKMNTFDKIKTKLASLEASTEQLQTRYETDASAWRVTEASLGLQISTLTETAEASTLRLQTTSKELATTVAKLAAAETRACEAAMGSDAEIAKVVADLRAALATRTTELEAALDQIATTKIESVQSRLRQQVRKISTSLTAQQAVDLGSSAGGTSVGDAAADKALLEEANLEAKALVETELLDTKRTVDALRAENETLRQKIAHGGGAPLFEDMAAFSGIGMETSVVDAMGESQRLGGKHQSSKLAHAAARTASLLASTDARSVSIALSNDDGEEVGEGLSPRAAASGGRSPRSGGGGNPKSPQASEAVKVLKKENTALKKAADEQLTEIQRLHDELEQMRKRGVQKSVDHLLSKPVATYAFDGKQTAGASTRAAGMHRASTAGMLPHQQQQQELQPDDAALLGAATAGAVPGLTPRESLVSGGGGGDAEDVSIKVPPAMKWEKAGKTGGGKVPSTTLHSSKNTLRAPVTPGRKKSVSGTTTPDVQATPRPPGEATAVDEPAATTSSLSTPSHRPLGDVVVTTDQVPELVWLRGRVAGLEEELATQEDARGALLQLVEELHGRLEAAQEQAQLQLQQQQAVVLAAAAAAAAAESTIAPQEKELLTALSSPAAGAASLASRSQQTSPLQAPPPLAPTAMESSANAIAIDDFIAGSVSIPSSRTRPQSAKSDTSTGGAVISSYEQQQAQVLTAEVESLKEQLAASERQCLQLAKLLSAPNASSSGAAAVASDGSLDLITPSMLLLAAKASHLEVECGMQTDLQGADVEYLLALASSARPTTAPSAAASSSTTAANGKRQAGSSYHAPIDDRRAGASSSSGRKPSLLASADPQRQENQHFFLQSTAAAAPVTGAVDPAMFSSPLPRRASSALAGGAHPAAGGRPPAPSTVDVDLSSLPPRPSTAMALSQDGHVVTTALTHSLPNMVGRTLLAGPAASLGTMARSAGSIVGGAGACAAPTKVAERIAQARLSSSSVFVPSASDQGDGGDASMQQQQYPPRQPVTLVKGISDASKYPLGNLQNNATPGTVLAIASHHNAVGFGGTTNAAAKQLASELLQGRKAVIDSSNAIRIPGASIHHPGKPQASSSLTDPEGGGVDAIAEDRVVPVERLFPMAVLDVSSGHDPANPTATSTSTSANVVDTRMVIAGMYFGYGKEGAAVRGVKDKIKQTVNVEHFMHRMLPAVGGPAAAAAGGGGQQPHDDSYARWNVSGVPAGHATPATTDPSSAGSSCMPTPAANAAAPGRTGGGGHALRPASGMQVQRGQLKPSPNSAVPVAGALHAARK